MSRTSEQLRQFCKLFAFKAQDRYVNFFSSSKDGYFNLVKIISYTLAFVIVVPCNTPSVTIAILAFQ